MVVAQSFRMGQPLTIDWSNPRDVAGVLILLALFLGVVLGYGLLATVLAGLIAGSLWAGPVGAAAAGVVVVVEMRRSVYNRRTSRRGFLAAALVGAFWRLASLALW